MNEGKPIAIAIDIAHFPDGDLSWNLTDRLCYMSLSMEYESTGLVLDTEFSVYYRHFRRIYDRTETDIPAESNLLDR